MDRRTSGTAIHVASAAYGMPLAAVVSAANVNDSIETPAVLASLVVKPPPADVPVARRDPRDLPPAWAAGAYGNRPRKERAAAAGFGREAPKRGRARRPGVGRLRCALERCQAFLAPCGRLARRLDRAAKRYRGWVQLAAWVIFIRHDANGFVR